MKMKCKVKYCLTFIKRIYIIRLEKKKRALKRNCAIASAGSTARAVCGIICGIILKKSSNAFQNKLSKGETS